MNEYSTTSDLTNDMQALVKIEALDTVDYMGEAPFAEAFEDALREVAEVMRKAEGTDVEERMETVKERTEKVSEAMAEIFDFQTISEWDNMSMEAREAKLSEYYTQLGEILGINAKGVIIEDCIAMVGEGVAGYNTGDGYIHIDYRKVQDPEQLAELLITTTHEARHQLQYEAQEDPSRFPWISIAVINEWEYNLRNYDDGSFGYEGYYKQFVEADARIFAFEVLIGYAEILGLK